MRTNPIKIRKEGTNAMIEMIDIHKTYNPKTTYKVEALRGVNLKIDVGEMVGIMGVSGSGKSTLLNIIGCLDTSTKGRAIVSGIDLNSLGRKGLSRMRNSIIGFALQDFGLIPNKTVYENVAYPLIFNKKVKYKDIRPMVEKALEATGIIELKDKLASRTSGGQKQRIAISRAIVNNPKLILADEPTANLDSATADEIMATFKELNDQGITIIIVTHDREIANICDRIINIADGVIVNDN